MKKISIFLILLAGCSSTSEWTVLFDGKKVNGLKGYKQTGFPSDDWVIVEGTLKTIPGQGVDLISEDIYKDFELELEWKVPTGGNSGIFYFATEEGDYIWQSAPEMQVLDDETHTNGENTLTSAQGPAGPAPRCLRLHDSRRRGPPYTERPVGLGEDFSVQ